MTTKLKHLPLFNHSKLISRLRAKERFTWTDVARTIIDEEAKTHPLDRPAGYKDHPDYPALVRNYTRSVKRVFDLACKMGYETPPPAGATFHSPDSSLRVAKHNPAVSERLEALQRQAIETPDDTLAMRVRSERERIRNMTRRAEHRIRHGRPILDRREATTFLPNMRYWDGDAGAWVTKPYPPITDLELVGKDRYDELIAARVQEVKTRPGATEEDIHMAQHPHLLPLEVESGPRFGGRRPDVRPKTEVFWHPAASPKNPTSLVDAERDGRNVIATVFAASAVWGIKRGKPPLGHPTMPDFIDAILDLVASGELGPFNNPEFANRIKTCNREEAHTLLQSKTRNLRVKFYFDRPVETPRAKMLVARLNAFVDSLPPKPVLGEGETYGRETSARAWIRAAWPHVVTFLRENPDFRV